MKTRYWLALVLVAALCRAAAAQQDVGFDLDKHLGPSWYGLYIGAKKCGYAAENLEKITHDGKPAYRFSTKVNMTIMLLGNPQKLLVTQSRTFYASGALAECFSGMGPQSYRGVMKGDTMTIISTVGGLKSEKSIPAPKVTLRDEVAPLRLILTGPKIGDSVESPTFDPMIGKELTAVVTVTGKKKILFGGVEMAVYEVDRTIKEMVLHSPCLINEAGEVLKFTIPLGRMEMVLKLEDEKTAKDQTVQSVEMLDASTIHPTGEVPPRAQASVKIRLTGIENEDCIINDTRQDYKALGDAVYEVTVRRDEPPAKARLLPITDDDVKEHTKPTVLYQSNHPEIVKKAREIIGEIKDSARASQGICLWVFANVKKLGTVSRSNALETLQSMQGDCSEHAALFVGLCRAVGLPARVVSGVAYSRGLGAFGGHAWAEVFVGKWIAVDPTFGEPIASPLRIKLGTDDILEAGRLFQFLGEVNIEFLKPEKE